MTVASIGSKFGGRKGISRKRNTAVQPRMNFNESLIYREYDYSMGVFRLSKVEACIKARPPMRGRALTKPTIRLAPTLVWHRRFTDRTVFSSDRSWPAVAR